MILNNKKSRWLFPTNTNNLRMTFAQGLFIPSSQSKKYYKDILSEYEGYLPLFKNEPTAESLNKATSEADHLTPCLIEIDIVNIKGKVIALTKNGYKEIELESVDKETSDINNIFIPLPIPLSCISKIFLKNKNDIENLKKDVKIKSNVIINELKLHTDSKLFNVNVNESKSLLKFNISRFNNLAKNQSVKTDYALINAYGGILSLLHYYAKNSEKSNKLFNKFIQKDFIKMDKSQNTPQLIGNLFFNEIDASSISQKEKFLKGIIFCCLESNNFKDSVINFLENNTLDDTYKKRTQELANRLKEYSMHNIHSTSDLLDSSKSDIEKSLLMLFTREDSKGLIDYSNPKVSFSENEQMLFSLFFGIRDGFIKTPEMIRKNNELQLYVSNQMASYAHKKMNSNISFELMRPPLLKNLSNKKSIINQENYKQTLNNIKNSKITDSMKNTIISFDKAARDAVKIGKRDFAKTIINGIYAVDRNLNKIEDNIKNNLEINIQKDDRLLLDKAFKAKTDLARSMSRNKERSNGRVMSL